MAKKIIALILCVTMLMTGEMLTLIANAIDSLPDNEQAIEPEVSVLYKDSLVSDLSFGESERIKLTARIDGCEAKAYQWQLLMDKENYVWVDVYDKTKKDCEISLAMLEGLLDSSNCAYIRCEVSADAGYKYYSEPIALTVIKATSDNEELDSESESASNGLGGFSLMAETNYVTITINYLDYNDYVDGNINAIYTPYVARIEEGSDFQQNVVSPTFLGYAPFWDPNGGDNITTGATTLELNYTGVGENIVINVYYKPIQVNYGIRYFFQNINDDLYTEDPARYHAGREETGTIITEETIMENAGDLTGFSKMYHIPDAVAADGSTVFECYYDRYYYLLHFDNNGGYGTDPIYARYGTPFIVNTPVRYGYQFMGWDLMKDTNDDGIPDTYDGVADEVPSTIQAIHDKSGSPAITYYKAIWQVAEANYTIVYWKENANDNGYSFWGSVTKQALSGTAISADGTSIGNAVADGMDDAEHFVFNPLLSDTDVTVSGDGTTVLNAYYTRKFYTITIWNNDRNSCDIPTDHVHTDDCYDYICNGEQHVHDENCTLTCTKGEHIHSAECCTLTEHDHTDACCSLEYHVHGEGDCMCTVEQHTHDVSCWENVGNSTTPGGTPPSNPKNGQIYRYRYFYGYYVYYIYINGTWYVYQATASNGTIIQPNCGKEEHTHGVDCACTETEHDHTSGCVYSKCGQTEHTHGDGNCYCEKESHVHGSECYDCGKELHEHTDACRRCICAIHENHTHSSACQTSESSITSHIYAKYEADISSYWPIKSYDGVTVYNTGQRWEPSDSSYYNAVLVFIATMPDEDFTLTLSEAGYGPIEMNYYIEVLPGESYEHSYKYNGETKYFNLYKTINANYNYVTEAEDFFNIAGFDNWTSDPGFKNGQISDDVVDFYYARTVSHKVKFSNNGLEMTDKTVTGIPYGGSLSHLNFTPQYPDNLEPDAYEFVGWYTSPGCFEGTQVNWSTITMEDNDMMFYAKWVPTTHDAKFFVTMDDMNEYLADNSKTDLIYASVSGITHGNVIGTSVENPTYEVDGDSLVFASWFYIDSNGERKAFEPTNMPVKGDMYIYAEWESKIITSYKIQYVLQSDPEIKVADDTMGYAYVGTTRTFQAKAGNPYGQLYAEYNTGYYPTVASHSITMQKEADNANPTVNVFTFYYAKATEISYTVNYVNKETNLVMEYKTVEATGMSVVTERFKAFTNMVPDAFYKRLVISVKWDPESNKYVGLPEDNVINFYYTPNTTSAYYAVHFMLQKLGGNATDYKIDGTGGYEEVGTHIEGIADVGSTVSITPQVIDGFQLANKAIQLMDGNQANVALSGGNYNISIDSDGTELYIFYTRRTFEYTVHYYEYNTTNSLKGSYTGSAPYGTTVTAEIPTIANYTCVNSASNSIEIRSDASQNVIILYYSPLQYVAEYVVVPEGVGMLSQQIEVIAGSENLVGSAPLQSEYYEFNGWFLDEECTIPVVHGTHGTIDAENRFIPYKSEMKANDRNIYYAKFTPKAGKLTINVGNASDETQVFVFNIQNNDTGTVLKVTIVGNGSVTIDSLLLGDYTITQDGDWCWRYNTPIGTNGSVSHSSPEGTTVNVSQFMNKDYYLNDNSDMFHNVRGEDNG